MSTIDKARWRRYVVWHTKVDSTTGCWVWQMSCGTGGYGHAGSPYRHGLSQYMHVVSYTVFIGPVPEGMQLRHQCHNPTCCNPDHLLVGTAQDNKDDNKRASRLSSKLILTAPQVQEIKRLLAQGAHTKTAIGAQFGVSRTTIYDIARGRIWSRV